MENDDGGTNQEIEGDDTRSDRSSELRVDLQNAEVMSPTPLGIGSLSSSSSGTSRIEQVIALIRGLPKDEIKMLGAAILEGAEVGEEAGRDSQRMTEEFVTPKKVKEASDDSFQKVDFETPRGQKEEEMSERGSGNGKGRGEAIPPKEERKGRGEEIPSRNAKDAKDTSDKRKGEEIPPGQQGRGDEIPSMKKEEREELPRGEPGRGTQTPRRSQDERSERGSPSQTEEALKMTQEVMKNQNQVNERMMLVMERLTQRSQDQPQSSDHHYQQPQQTENKVDKVLKSDVKIQKIHFGEVGTRAVELENWLKDSRSKVRQISDCAEAVWDAMVQQVEYAYYEFQDATGLGRLQVKTQLAGPEDQSPEVWSSWNRVRNILSPILRDAIPADLKQRLLQSNEMEPEQTLFALYRKAAPGGPEERSSLLSQIQNPEIKTTNDKGETSYSKIVEGMRDWNTRISRVKKMPGVEVPDSSILWKALQTMTTKALDEDKDISHRVRQAQTELGLPYRPTPQSVESMYQLILSEFEIKADAEVVPKKGKGKDKGKGDQKEEVDDPQIKSFQGYSGYPDYKGKDGKGKGGKGKGKYDEKGKGKDDSKGGNGDPSGGKGKSKDEKGKGKGKSPRHQPYPGPKPKGEGKWKSE